MSEIINMPGVGWIETVNPIVPGGICDHLWNHGTYPRGYLHREDCVAKKLRDSHRAKNKSSRIARRITRLRDKTQH